MTSIMLTVTGAQACATVTGTLTSGMVGIPVTIQYDQEWDGLTKNLVCRCGRGEPDSGDEQRAILNIGETATVAHEVMKADLYLYLGVEGYSPDGKLVIPTRWAECGLIQNGATTGANLSADPTLPVWNQLQAQIEQIKGNQYTEEQVSEIQSCAQSAIQAASTAAGAADEAEQAAQAAAVSAGLAEASAVRAENAVGALQDPVNAGLNETATTLLVTILRSGVYSTDQSANITALEAALGSSGGSGDSGGDSGGDEPVVTTYTITAELANVTSSNDAASVTEGASYTATLTAADGYEISAVTVLMGGVNVTATVYADGVITIPAVTGNVIITATAVIPDDGAGDVDIDIPTENLMGYYDMRTALTDSGHITDLSGNDRDILFYPDNGYYAEGCLYRGDKVTEWANPAAEYAMTDGAAGKYTYGENVTVFITIMSALTGTTPLVTLGQNTSTHKQILVFQQGIILYRQAGFNDVSSSTKLTENVITTVCAVITPTEEKIYVNGVLKNNSAAKTSEYGDAFRLLYGYSNSSADVNTKVFNAAVYDAVLTDAEIVAISTTLLNNAGGVA